MPDFDDCIIFLLAKAYQKAHGVLRRRLVDYGITPIQNLVLETLRMEDGLSTGEVGKRLGLDSATLSGVLDRLEEGAWISRRADGEDRRVIRVLLTVKARERIPALVNERKEANVEILSRLNGEEQILLRRLLRDVKG